MILLLTTIAAQVGAAWWNCSRQAKLSAELAERQQAIERELAGKQMERARQEFAALCALQRELAGKMNADRMEALRQSHLSGLELTAYRQSLANWPLLVPPFVMKRQGLPIAGGNEAENATVPLHVVMTPSMHNDFNRHVLAPLEGSVSVFCDTCYNSLSPRPVCYYEGAWRDTMSDAGSRVRDLRAHLRDVPCLVLSPQMDEGRRVTFRVAWWGLSGDADDEHLDDLFDPELPPIRLPEGADEAAETLAVRVKAFIGLFADLYFWNFYGRPFALPRLLQDGVLRLSENERKQYAVQYTPLLLNAVDRRATATQRFDDPVTLVEQAGILAQMDTTLPAKLCRTLEQEKTLLDKTHLPLIDWLVDTNHDAAAKRQMEDVKSDILLWDATAKLPVLLCQDVKNLRRTLEAIIDNGLATRQVEIGRYAGNVAIAKLYDLDDRKERDVFLLVTSKPLSQSSLQYKNGKFIAASAAQRANTPIQVSQDYVQHMAGTWREFLDNTRKRYENIKPVEVAAQERIGQRCATDESPCGAKFTSKDLLRWIKQHCGPNNTLRLVIGYNSEAGEYILMGVCSKDGEVVEEPQLLERSVYMDPELVRSIGYKATVTINLK